MTLAWFSPLRPVHSDIANFTGRLYTALQEQFETRFITESDDGFLEPAAEKLYSGGCGPLPHDLLLSLNAVDVPVYNLGNNPLFFAQTWFLNQHKPGIVILHDVKMHHFFEGVFRARLRDEKRYLRVLGAHGGPIARQAGQAYCRSRLTIDFMAEHFPMTALAVQNALAVVVHTPFAREAVRKVSSVPVWTIPLPYKARVNDSHGIDVEIQPRQACTPDRPARLAIFGYLNTNRRIIEFLHALAGLPERNCFEVDLIGTLQHPAEICAAVELLNLRDRVKFHGYVPDERLEELLDAADFAINLRYPTMGESSGSQLRIWDHALPSLVTDADAYADLPPDAVFYVRPGSERLDIQRHLRHFLRRPGLFREKGRRGRKWLVEHHQPSSYVDALRSVCETVGALRSRHNRLQLAERVGRAVATWTSTRPDHDRERHYAARIAEVA